VGLRERKKERTRQHIADTAWRLFVDRGFDGVSVAQVAQEAEVSEATVFNYFRTKEDLFYFRLEAFETQLLDALRARAAGEPVLTAVRRFLLRPGGLLAQVASGDHEAFTRLRTVNRIIAASPALLARERQAIARATDALADLLLAEAGRPHDPVGAHVAANALMGVHRALIDYVRRRVLGGDHPERLAVDVRRAGNRAFALLEHGLGDYAPGHAASTPAATRPLPPRATTS
jgi:AcrR family transcriptional regulator